MFYWLCFFCSILSAPSLNGAEKSHEERLQEDNRTTLEYSCKVAQFYTLAEGEDFKEITQDLVESELTKKFPKEHIRKTGRRFFVFSYPSGGYRVKGYISFVPNPEGSPLLVFLRGGNRMFGLMNPATAFSCMRNFTVLATTFRGGVSEGKDEFGGAEVDDVQNLIDYLP